jgi:hypothetical protein
MILHGEALFGADLNTQIAGAAFQTIYLPFFGIFGDGNGMGWTAPAAQAAENAVVNGNFNSASGNLCINPLPHRVHECRRPSDQILHQSFCHAKQFHNKVVPAKTER